MEYHETQKIIYIALYLIHIMLIFEHYMIHHIIFFAYYLIQ